MTSFSEFDVLGIATMFFVILAAAIMMVCAVNEKLYHEGFADGRQKGYEEGIRDTKEMYGINCGKEFREFYGLEGDNT